MTNAKILFRICLDEEKELETASRYFECLTSRNSIPENSFVIGRYSVLPYYQELEEDLKIKNSYLINSWDQHNYIADMSNWYQDVKDYTPKTWFEWYSLPENMKFIVKGKTNSRKFQWNKRMFCETKEQLHSTIRSLLDDCLISQQGLAVREYVPLKTFDHGINGMPITNEWRFFLYKKQIVDYGYYWSIYDGEKPKDVPKQALDLIERLSEIVSQHTNFYVLDIAETQTGEWILIEINDAQMSGLSDIDQNKFYNALSKIKLV